ncbi:MAG: hypothetical protein ACREP6_10090 [Candidatus Binataceae bacterium]
MERYILSAHAARRCFANAVIAAAIALAALLIIFPLPVPARTLNGGVQQNTLNGNVQQNACWTDSPGPGWVREELDIAQCPNTSGSWQVHGGACVWRKCPPPEYGGYCWCYDPKYGQPTSQPTPLSSGVTGRYLPPAPSGPPSINSGVNSRNPGYYPMPPPSNYTPPYIPPVPGSYNVCDNPNAWRIPQCQHATRTPSRAPRGAYTCRACYPNLCQTTGDIIRCVPPSNTPRQPTTCQALPFDVRADIPDAAPQLRYALGFERGFAGCLEKQITVWNLALAAGAARYQKVAIALAVAATPGVIDGVLHPPGIALNPNPYLRGKDEGFRLCDWALKISPAVVARCRSDIRGPTTAVTRKLPSFRELMSNFGWLKGVNETGCQINCGPCTIRVINALFGKGIRPARSTKCGMTDPQMERALGGKFSIPMTLEEMYKFVESQPEGTIGAVSGENPNYKPQPISPGGFTSWDQIPGHFFAAVKYGEPVFLDGQHGGETTEMPFDWMYRYMKLGNGETGFEPEFPQARGPWNTFFPKR